MGIDLEWHQSQRIEAARIDDGHVIRGGNRRRRQHRSGAPANIGRASAYGLPDRFQAATLAQFVQQAEGVASADEQDVGLRCRCGQIGTAVCTCYRQSQRCQGLAHQVQIGVPVHGGPGKGEKQCVFPAAGDVGPCVTGVLSVWCEKIDPIGDDAVGLQVE